MATKDLSGQQVGMSPTSPLNSPRPNNERGVNVFPQSYKFLTTDCYGLYSPFYWSKCERGDVMNLFSKHDLHTFTLQSPMVSDVSMTKSYVKVPMQAIYPRNWDLMLPIPTRGEDVPFDTRSLLDIKSLITKLLSRIVNPDTTGINFIKYFLLLEAISSNGSLFARFNIHFNHRFELNTSVQTYEGSIDKILDEFFWPAVIDFGRSHPLQLDDDSYVYVGNLDSDDTHRYVSPRRFVELIRSNEVSFSDSWEVFNSEISIDSFSIVSGYLGSSSDNGYLINIEPIISYQLACAQFATNDFVDYIYSAKLYTENQQSILFEIAGFVPTFLYNGMVRQYDVFSKRYIDYSIEYLGVGGHDYLLNLFSYVPSLRYGDYFTGAKTQPLAVGEYSANVVNGEVSAVDITKSIQMQRLLNRVNMVGRKIGDYLAGIFGGQLPPADKDVPVFLAHQRFGINGFETNNTGAAQLDSNEPNTITSHLRSTDSKVAFEVQIDEPCYIIGMNSYESARIYSKTIDRFAFHHDRYDDFIPEQQYIGDQDIKVVELDSSSNNLTPFGYCLRYMEYKQRYSYASGGFIENLPSWAFITDNTDGNPHMNNITPSYIRSSPSEFDRFYKALSGYSLGSYFHFIVAHENISEPIRRMEYTPEILK